MNSRPGTYQALVVSYGGVSREAGDAVLAEYAALFSQLERRLFRDLQAGGEVGRLKKEYLKKDQISARMFNALSVSVRGKISSVVERRKVEMEDLEDRIGKAKAVLKKEEKKGRKSRGWFHQKRRRLGNLEQRLENLESDVEAGKVRLCFGSRKLWRKGLDLEANGYSSKEDWLKDWREARKSEVFVLGSKDETAGCQGCVVSYEEDGTFTLRLRVPDRLAPVHGKYLYIEGVRFHYGEEHILAALELNGGYGGKRRRGDEHPGQALSFRFKRGSKGWVVSVTTDMKDVPVVTDVKLGAVGVDVNTDHLAVAEADSSGNYVNAFSVPMVTYGKSRGQSEAVIGDAVARVVEYARSIGKPLVIEKLDFRKKKAVLEMESPKRSRMLSSFCYSRVNAFFKSRGYRNGVEVGEVNPAYSSLVGRVKFSERYGLSVDQSAALVLARRLLGCSERIPHRRVCPVGNGVCVAFAVPVRIHAKHVWTYWGAIRRQLRPALAAQHRRAKSYPARACKRGETSDEGLGADQFGVSGRDSRTGVAFAVGVTAQL